LQPPGKEAFFFRHEKRNGENKRQQIVKGAEKGSRLKRASETLGGGNVIVPKRKEGAKEKGGNNAMTSHAVKEDSPSRRRFYCRGGRPTVGLSVGKEEEAFAPCTSEKKRDHINWPVRGAIGHASP